MDGQKSLKRSAKRRRDESLTESFPRAVPFEREGSDEDTSLEKDKYHYQSRNKDNDGDEEESLEVNTDGNTEESIPKKRKKHNRERKHQTAKRDQDDDENREQESTDKNNDFDSKKEKTKIRKKTIKDKIDIGNASLNGTVKNELLHKVNVSTSDVSLANTEQKETMKSPQSTDRDIGYGRSADLFHHNVQECWRSHPRSQHLLQSQSCPEREQNIKILSLTDPESALKMFCDDRNWAQPDFDVITEPDTNRKERCIATVVVNNTSYQPKRASNNKKQARKMAAIACLQALGMLPNSAENKDQEERFRKKQRQACNKKVVTRKQKKLLKVKKMVRELVVIKQQLKAYKQEIERLRQITKKCHKCKNAVLRKD